MIVGAPQTDFWKVFDCFSHKLLVAKLSKCRVETLSVRLMYNYFSKRRLRTNAGNKYSSCWDIFLCVPHRSILGPLLFNIYICNLFLLVNDRDIANYAGNATRYGNGDQKPSNSLERSVNVVLSCFTDN